MFMRIDSVNPKCSVAWPLFRVASEFSLCILREASNSLSSAIELGRVDLAINVLMKHDTYPTYLHACETGKGYGQ